MLQIIAQDTNCAARLGHLNLPHGQVDTPCFMPVGTNATVKAADNRDLLAMGYNLILGNAYHLYLRPSLEVIKHAGGLHQFMAWPGNILTDSGGFQVFSLAPFRKITEEGIAFRSHIDGSAHRLSPEDVVDIQSVLQSDIAMPLDVCTEPGISHAQAAEAVRITSLWAGRSLEHHQKINQELPWAGALFAIVQGNFFTDLRTRSAAELVALDFPGYAIGGLSVGEQKAQFIDLLAYTAPLLPENKPRYLMGIGTPDYIFEAVEQGIDLFDCVYPTRIARNALAFTRQGNLNLRLERNKLDLSPIDPGCTCPTCHDFSRSYLRHLFKAREIQAAVLTTRHNLYFLRTLMDGMRQAIKDSRLRAFKKAFFADYGLGTNAD